MIRKGSPPPVGFLLFSLEPKLRPYTGPKSDKNPRFLPQQFDNFCYFPRSKICYFISLPPISNSRTSVAKTLNH